MTTPAMILLGVMAVVIRYLITARPYASRQLHTARARPTLVRDGPDVHFCAV
jgi:hypothetical protein